MNKQKIKVLFAFLLLLSTIQVLAQSGVGSMTVENSTVTIAEGSTEMRFSETTYFGPEADWTIDGTLEIWSKNVWIATDARIKGAGKIIVHNPGTNPFYPQMAKGATIIDGNNNNFIQLLVEHRNDDNVVLDDVIDPGYNTYNPPGSEAARLNFGAELNLAVNGANIILNGNDLGFNASGTITDYSPQRMIVTNNSINGHVIKEYLDNGNFIFPVGIAERDYTPATITASEKGNVHVSVQDYTGSNTRLEDRQLGIDRSWHIYSGNPLKADVSLYHNLETSGSKYIDDKASVAQYAGSTDWNLLETTSLSSGIHRTLNAAIIANQIESGVWFTKYSINPTGFFIPNVFTPNGDGSFDTFIITGLEEYDSAEVIILNRWGNEVYRNSDYNNNWDGYGLNEGTYYYLINLVKDGKRNVYKGWLLLKR
jgi:gliding motility-associated-like protein